jgi:hypothetical protein
MKKIFLFALFLNLSLFVFSETADGQDFTLKQKLEKGIIKTQVFQDQKVLVAMQDPVNGQTKMVAFKSQLVEWPFRMKYPASWYVREAFYGTSSLYITQEPVKQINDTFSVGMSLYYFQNYFSIQKASEDSKTGKLAESVLYKNDWVKSKAEYIRQIKKSADKVISIEETEFALQPAVCSEHQLNGAQVITYYVKAGNNLLQIIFEAPQQEFGNFETIFGLIADSFYFTR